MLQAEVAWRSRGINLHVLKILSVFKCSEEGRGCQSSSYHHRRLDLKLSVEPHVEKDRHLVIAEQQPWIGKTNELPGKAENHLAAYAPVLDKVGALSCDDICIVK